jgi:hypothetical protein
VHNIRATSAGPVAATIKATAAATTGVTSAAACWPSTLLRRASTLITALEVLFTQKIIPPAAMLPSQSDTITITLAWGSLLGTTITLLEGSLGGPDIPSCLMQMVAAIAVSFRRRPCGRINVGGAVAVGLTKCTLLPRASTPPTAVTINDRNTRVDFSRNVSHSQLPQGFCKEAGYLARLTSILLQVRSPVKTFLSAPLTYWLRLPRQHH